jgi:hypothetical protein
MEGSAYQAVGRSEPGDLGRDLAADVGGDGLAVDDLRHCRTGFFLSLSFSLALVFSSCFLYLFIFGSPSPRSPQLYTDRGASRAVGSNTSGLGERAWLGRNTRGLRVWDEMIMEALLLQ